MWYGTYRFYVCMAGIWCKTGHHDDGKSNWKWSSGRSICHDKRVAEYSLEPGDHGTTYGGNPLACAAVAKTLELFEKYDLTAHVREIGAYLTEKLDELVAANDAVLERRGIGLIQGIKVKKPVGEISSEALKEGLLIISAKGNVLRLVPPLVIEKEHVDEMLEILKKVL